MFNFAVYAVENGKLTQCKCPGGHAGTNPTYSVDLVASGASSCDEFWNGATEIIKALLCKHQGADTIKVVGDNGIANNEFGTEEDKNLNEFDLTSSPADKLPLIHDNLLQLKESIAGKQELNDLEQDGVELRIQAAKKDLEEVALYLTESKSGMEYAIEQLDEAGAQTWCKSCILELYGYTNQEGEILLHSKEDKVDTALELSNILILVHKGKGSVVVNDNTRGH